VPRRCPKRALRRRERTNPRFGSLARASQSYTDRSLLVRARGPNDGAEYRISSDAEGRRWFGRVVPSQSRQTAGCLRFALRRKVLRGTRLILRASTQGPLLASGSPSEPRLRNRECLLGGRRRLAGCRERPAVGLIRMGDLDVASIHMVVPWKAAATHSGHALEQALQILGAAFSPGWGLGLQSGVKSVT
jgi:hypothetical protein